MAMVGQQDRLIVGTVKYTLNDIRKFILTNPQPQPSHWSNICHLMHAGRSSDS